MSDVDFDAFLDTDMLGPEWTSAVPHTDLPSDWLAVDPLQDLNAASELSQFETDGEAEVVTYEGHIALDSPTTVFGQSILDFGYRFEQPASSASQSKYPRQGTH